MDRNEYFNSTGTIHRYVHLILLICFLMPACHDARETQPAHPDAPDILDDRLELTLFAEEPDIVTPVGMAIDSLDRIYVLESHTHMPPSDYEGPDTDLIKVFEDRNGDGVKDTVSVFAEGFIDGMNMAFSPDGVLYLVTAMEVWALYDHNGDGTSDEQVKVLELTEPSSVYSHAALLGITFSPDGWMYISRGNTSGSAWEFTGSDGQSVSGFGDGGNIFRARPDGTDLEEVATGFWNPFSIQFDRYGRLLAADNDSNDRGPNRLLHIIHGGDYGYMSLYGGSGIHPYLAWDGELPGTLPIAVPLGEAPSGLLDAEYSSLPEDYRGDWLSSIWEENRIVRIRLEPNGVSVTGETEVIMEGGLDFRPVAFATDSEGSVYFADWVSSDYPNHGRGKIWKLTSRPDVDTIEPLSREEMFASPRPDPGVAALDEVYSHNSPADYDRLMEFLESEDPFIHNAAISVLSDPVFQNQLIEAVSDDNPDVRARAIVALHRSGLEDAEAIARTLLEDPDITVRHRALMWIGREGMRALYSDIDLALTSGQVTPDLFDAYLATAGHLNPEFIEAYRNQESRYSDIISQPLPSGFIESFLSDRSRDAELRALAIKFLGSPEENADLLVSLLEESEEPAIVTEAVRSLAYVSDSEIAEHLATIATDDTNPSSLRAEALVSLSHQPADVSAEIIPLLDDSQADIRMEAARYLRTRLSSDGVAEALAATFAEPDIQNQPGLREQISISMPAGQLQGSVPERPSSVEEWQEAIHAGDGDPERGLRVFRSTHSTCSSCHVFEGRGGNLGPDLTNIGQSRTREQIVNKILRPNDSIAPGWLGWFIRKKNGETVYGRNIDGVGRPSLGLHTEHDGFVRVDTTDIEEYGMVEGSLMPAGLETRLTVTDIRDLISLLGGREE